MRNFSAFNLAQLEQLVVNYNRGGAVHGEDYAALLREREAKSPSSRKLDIYRSLELLKSRARTRSFASYGELAAASDVRWTNELRTRMSGPKGHLDRLLDLCRHERLPMLTTLCVDKQNVATGLLTEAALAGFVAAARRLGTVVGDEATFLRERQEECFRWGDENAAPATATGTAE